MKIFEIEGGIGARWILAISAGGARALAAQIAADKNKPAPALTGRTAEIEALEDCVPYYVGHDLGYTRGYGASEEHEPGAQYWGIDCGSSRAVAYVRTGAGYSAVSRLTAVAQAIYGDAARIEGVETRRPLGVVIDFAALSAALS